MAADKLLIEAAKNGDLTALRERIAAGADIDAMDQGGDNALHWAAWKGNTEAVRLLLEKGADVGVVNTSSAWKGCTAATLAKREKHLETEAVLNIASQRTSEKWIVMGAASVAHEGIYPQLEKRLVQIFNFASRERLLMTENLRNNTEIALPPTPFDALPQSLLETALAEFTRFGGKADRDFVLHGDNPLGKPRKPTLTQER